MSTFETDGWDADETIALISIMKTLKDSNVTGNIGRKDWQYVANEMSECLRDANYGDRSIPELRERYKKLRNDYITARFRNRSCQFYNMLHNLFGNDMPIKMRQVEQEKDFEEVPEVEHKYADTLQLEHNDENTNRPSGFAGKLQSRCKWSDGELKAFCDIVTTLKLQAPLMRKRNEKVFKVISREMAKRNFVKRPDELRDKYDQLKRQYAEAKKGGESIDQFEDMHALLNGSIQNGESSGGELESDTIDSGEDDNNAHMESGSESEGAVASLIPSKARVKWAEGEVVIFLDLINSLGLQSAILRKRNAKIFKLLSKEMAKKFIDRPAEKLRIKFQQLRRQYNKTNRGGESFEHYEAMHKLLSYKDENPDANFSSGSESDFIDSDDGDADSPKRQTDRYYWTDNEVDIFLSIIKKQNLFRALDGSKKRNFKILVYISNVLAKQSCKRTPHQLRNKLRLLLRRYREVKKDGVTTGRMQPRHFEILDDLVQKKRTSKSVSVAAKPATNEIKTSPKTVPPVESDIDSFSDVESSCDLLRAAAESEDGEESFVMPAEPTPLEVLTTISEGQKQLMTMLTTSHDSFLRQQREMQSQFLRELSNIMRQEREATVKMLRELMQPK